MIMPIALARDGFITKNENVTFDNNDDFFTTLKKIFNFEDKDLQFFDGNTCRLVTEYDPTGSIFIYTNDKDTTLYTITSASSVIFKKNLVWECQCHLMEFKSKIDSICNNVNKSAECVNFNNIFYSNKSTISPFSDSTALPQPITTIKGNFKTKSVITKRLIQSKYMWLKIKCYVNPTTSDLTSTSPDGSYNFFYPIKIEVISNVVYISNYIQQYMTDGSLGATCRLVDIISKFSPNIKSIELLPHIPSTFDFGGCLISLDKDDMGGSSTPSRVVVRLDGFSVFTECGVFVSRGFTDRYFSLGEFVRAQTLPEQLVKGGGARGFLQTPLGNIQVDFQQNKGEELLNEYNTPDICYCLIKEEGFLLDGAFKCEVPPHYLNFYTDNAGQLFIQNLTTNAQELRSLERATVARYEEQEQDYAFKQVNQVFNNAFGAIGNVIQGNWLGMAGNIANAGTSWLMNSMENDFIKARIDRNYNRSVTEYEDQIQTQSLLASMTGKTINGQFSLLDFLAYVNLKYFKIYIELNYQMNYLREMFGQQYTYDTQPDYDYSCANVVNQGIAYGSSTYISGRLILSPRQTPNVFNYVNNVSQLLQTLFGYSNTPQYSMIFKNNIGALCYNVVFRLENILFDTQDDANADFTNIIKIGVRNNIKKVLSI